jgi:hypothetical protein
VWGKDCTVLVQVFILIDNKRIETGLMVFETVRRARRRILANEVVRQTAYCCSAVLASLILLLLLGTQILSWLLLLALPLVALAAGAYATWRRMPSSYQVAQRVDRELDLADTLSTALYFAVSDNDNSGPADVRRAQLAQAERLADGLDLRRAVPIRAPKAAYLTAVLGLIVSSLFALRYGLDHRLDLRVPLARIIQEKLGAGAQPQAARLRKNPSPPRPGRPQDYGLSLDEGQTKGPGELDPAADAALDTVGVPETDNSKSNAARAAESKPGPSGQNAAGKSASDDAEGISTNAEGEQSADGSQGKGTGKQGQEGGKQASSGAGENSSLLNKFRDAMSNLLSRMQPQPGAAGTPQQASAQAGRQSQNQPGNGRQNGKQGQPSADSQQSDAQDGQPGEEGQTAQNAQSRSGGESGPEPNSKQPGSGVGRQDGSKDVKLAEQLAAMGKISEIIGKRAANVTGELTVEVQNSNQQLRTPYAPSAAHHQEAGGEISRDEVPVALQAYVQQYFEQLRKQAPDPGGAPPRPETHGRRRADPPKTPGL